MYIFINKTFVNKQQETSQVETFIQLLEENNLTASGECMRLLGSYKFILSIRNLLHLHSQSKADRFEFTEQIKLARILGFHENDLTDFMKIYFKASSIIHRFTISMIKKFNDDLTASLPASMAFALDDDFELKGNIISPKHEDNFSMSDILRAFYYRGLYSARFDEALRSSIVEKIESAESKQMYGSPGMLVRLLLL
jgi:[protein-PII] uridylyltransferase